MGSFPSNAGFFIVMFQVLDMNANPGGVSRRPTICPDHQPILSVIHQLIELFFSGFIQCGLISGFPPGRE